jgi:uncharacterized repeat protein (TIGR01451 family)
MMKYLLGLLFLALTLVLVTPDSEAAPVTNDFGLANPTTTITFDEIVLAPAEVVTNQYEALGVIFSPNLYYDPQGPAGPSLYPGVSGHNLGNFFPIVNPFSIQFSTPQIAVAFGIATNPANTEFTAKLNGIVVETYQSATDATTAAVSFQGFEGVLFDEIEISTVGSNEALLIDNIQTGGQLLGSDHSGNLFSIDTTTGEGTLIGQETAFGPFTEIEFDVLGGLLYGEESGDSLNLHTVDPATGLSTGFVTHVCCALTGLEFVGPVLYGTNVEISNAPSTLVIVDPTTGLFTPVGLTGVGPIPGLAYHTALDTMFGVTNGTGETPAQLLTLDLGTGIATLGPVLLDSVSDAPFDRVGSIEFGADGVLYGSTSQNATLNPGWLFSIDVSTGLSTFIGPTGFAGVTGLTFGAAPPPPPSALADLVISKSDSDDPAAAGTNLTYTIRVDNQGDAAADDVVVTDTLPAGVTLVSTTGCAEDPSGVPTCSLGTIDVGGFAEYTATVAIDPSVTGPIINNVSVATSSEESDTGNNSAMEETTVVAEADLSITKMASSDSVISGGNQTLDYIIEVSNAGPSDATNVVVTDTLSPLAIFESTTGCQNDPFGVPDCQLGTIAAGASASYSITVSLQRADGTLVNSASVTSDAFDPDEDNSTVDESVEVTAIPIPTLGVLGLTLLILLMSGFGWVSIRRT